MKIRTKRDEEPQEVKSITVFIGENRYRMNETIDGKLEITKYSDGLSDYMDIRPSSGNEIKIT